MGKPRGTLPADEAQRLLHELRVHQAELEAQNEELRAAQHDLEASRAQYFELYDLAPVGLFKIDEHNLILEANIVAAELLGTARRAMTGKPLTHFILADDQDIFYRFRQSLAKTGDRQECELRLASPEREPTWVNIVGAPATGDSASPGRQFRIVMTNVAERKRQDQRIVDSEARVREIVELTAAGYFFVDRAGRFQRVNDAWLRMHGFDRADEVIGQHFSLTQVETDLEAAQRSVARLLAGEPIPAGEFSRRCRDGSVRYHTYTAHPVMQGDRVVGLEGFLIDTTERHQHEQELAAAKALAETADAAKSRFLATMSHEIRTPMNGVIGMLDVALHGPLEPGLRASLDLARESGMVLVKLLNDILDLSKIESGKSQAERDDFAIRDLVDAIVMTVKPAASQKGLALRRSIADAVPQRLRGIPMRLRQILLNLVDNAVKFTDQGFCAVEIEVIEAPPGPAPAPTRPTTVRVRFSVRDTGIGIPTDKQAVIFEPFTQADSTTTRRFGGTGLGLTICRRLVESMGGEMTVESAVGVGSRFSFTIGLELPPGEVPTLPANHAPAPQPVAARADATVHALRILVVDDSAVSRTVLKQVLTLHGYSTEVATSGADALTKLAQQAYDLVLLDVEMPVMTGLEVVEKIRTGAVPGVRTDLPVIAVTAHAMIGDREQFLAAGMDGYLSKPFDPQVLFETMRRVVTAKAAAGEAPDRSAVAKARGRLPQPS